MRWLPEPEPGTPICAAFDGSDVSDWTVLRAETRDGFSFTPRYGPDRRPTIWRPDEWPDGRIPRSQVSLAVDELFDRFDVERVYCDPWRWESDIDEWALRYPERVAAWDTSRVKAMHEALERFHTDLSNGRVTHDGCPLTALCMANARKLAKSSDRYLLAKPSQMQKIDAAMATVLAHEAAADARAAGWADNDTRVFAFS